MEYKYSTYDAVSESPFVGGAPSEEAVRYHRRQLLQPAPTSHGFVLLYTALRSILGPPLFALHCTQCYSVCEIYRLYAWQLYLAFCDCMRATLHVITLQLSALLFLCSLCMRHCHQSRFLSLRSILGLPQHLVLLTPYCSHCALGVCLTCCLYATINESHDVNVVVSKS